MTARPSQHRGAGQAGAMIGDAIYRRRLSNRIKAIIALAEQVRESGISLDVLRADMPHGWACDVLDAMERVDDDDMRELWARLLVAPVLDSRHEHPAFIDLLRRMSPSDAQVFRKVAAGTVPAGLSGPPGSASWIEVHDVRRFLAEIDRLDAFGLCVMAGSYE